jgi:hypothetical protein
MVCHRVQPGTPAISYKLIATIVSIPPWYNNSPRAPVVQGPCRPERHLSWAVRRIARLPVREDRSRRGPEAVGERLVSVGWVAGPGVGTFGWSLPQLSSCIISVIQETVLFNGPVS